MNITTKNEELTGARLLRVREIAEVLSLHPQSVRRLIWNGILPSVRVGHSVRARAGDVQNFLDNCPTAARETA